MTLDICFISMTIFPLTVRAPDSERDMSLTEAVNLHCVHCVFYTVWWLYVKSPSPAMIDVLSCSRGAGP